MAMQTAAWIDKQTLRGKLCLPEVLIADEACVHQWVQLLDEWHGAVVVEYVEFADP